jgi:hypothetical protein
MKTRKIPTSMLLVVVGLVFAGFVAGFIHAPWQAIMAGLAGVGILTALAGATAVREGWKSRRWPSADGIVEKAELTDRNGLDGDATTVSDLRYSYQVGGRRYCGDRDAIGLGQGSARASAAIRGLVVGGPVKVFYDPEAPALSVLRPGITLSAAFVVLAGLACVAGACVGLVSS